MAAPLLRKNAPNFVKEPTPVGPVLSETKSTQKDRVLEQDRLEPAIVFLAAEKSKRIKIPGVIRGETVLPTPLFVEFVDHKYTCRSKRVAQVLKGYCSPSGVLELKG